MPAELGDFNPIENRPGYLSDMQLLNDQNEETERRIAELHKLHRGQLPADAEYNFLEHAKRLDMYGIDFHKGTVSTVCTFQISSKLINNIILFFLRTWLAKTCNWVYHH
jgi:tyrosine-protein phosphatase non-receptor type 4